MILKKIYKYFKQREFLYIIKKRDITILWFPYIESTEEFSRELSRIVWYLNPISKKIKNITLIVNSEININHFTVPDYIDNSIKKLYEQLEDKIIFKNEIEKNIKYDVIIKWKNIKTKIMPKALTTIHSDINFHQFDSTKLIKFSRNFLVKNEIIENNNRLKNLLENLINLDYKSVLLVGSGPSGNKINPINNTEVLSIICNSVVNNKELLQKINPSIIVATDTVFHSGYSKYAEEFRKKTCKVLDEYPQCFFLVPTRDLLIYKSNMNPIYHNRIIGIEGKKNISTNLNLLKRQVVKSTSNVLTFFMLPLATTISKEILLIGFDGKGKNENNKFWSYEKKSQFIEQMKYTKIAHPAFYKVNYQEYNTTHLKEVEKIIDILIDKKVDIRSLTPSHIPTINKFYS